MHPITPLGSSTRENPRSKKLKQIEKRYGKAVRSAVTCRGISKAAMKRYGLSDRIIKQIKTQKGPISENRIAALRAAVKSTNYARLKRSGVTRKEAIKISQRADSTATKKALNEMRAYAEEMVVRYKYFKDKKKWMKDVAATLKGMVKKNWTLAEWKKASDDYSKKAGTSIQRARIPSREERARRIALKAERNRLKIQQKRSALLRRMGYEH
jgi:hypothetical protein